MGPTSAPDSAPFPSDGNRLKGVGWKGSSAPLQPTLSLPLRIVCELIWTALHSVGNHGHGHGLAWHAKSMYYYCCCYYYGMIVMETIFCFFLPRAIMHGIILGIPSLSSDSPTAAHIQIAYESPPASYSKPWETGPLTAAQNSTKSRSYRAPVNPRGNLGRGAYLFHIGPGSPACQPRNSLGPGATRATGMNPSPPSPSPFDHTHTRCCCRDGLAG